MKKFEHKEQSYGLLSIVKTILNEPMPRGVHWPQTLGSVLLALIVVQIVTGILLSLYYSPNAESAYESVQYIEQHVVFGRLIRGIHYFAASGMVIVLFLHILRTFFYGAYKRPRQWTWIFGVVLLLLVMGFGFTGYLLPWDMKAFFATKVGINIAGVVPLLGQVMVKIMRGGSEMGTITLSRFFSLHVIILPLLLLLCVSGHLFYVRLHGPTPPGMNEGDKVEYRNRFYPLQLFRDSLVTFVVVGVIVILALKYGAPLESRADANDTTYIPRPDWYFYSLFQLLKIFAGKMEIFAAVILPGAFFMLLIFLPFLDRNPERRLSRRPIAASLGSGAVLVIVLLTAWGAFEGERAKQLMSMPRTAPIAVDLQKPIRANPENGKRLFTELKCGECHKQFTQGVNIPPGLEFSGDKYQPSWLREYLQDPYRIRWQRKNERPTIRMPDFDLTTKEARDLAAYLMNNKQSSKFSEHAFNGTEADSEMVESGKELVFEYGCYGCHKINEEGQNIGPDLSHAGSKLLENYMYHLIKSPQKIVPNTAMKDFKLDDADVEDIVAYLRELK